MQMVSTAASPAPELSFSCMLCGTLGMAAAACVLAWQPEAFMTRWHPAMLAAVHLFAVGGLMPVMLGALLQFMPVACGLALPCSARLDGLILGGLMSGAAALAAGFLLGGSHWLAAAGLLLFSSLGVAGLRLARALWQQRQASALQAALRRSALALGATLALAAILLGILLAGWQLPLMLLVDWHALWGLGGWVGGLIGSVATVVVPMFHVSQPYPARWETLLRALPWLLAAGLGAALAGWPLLAQASAAGLAALVLIFGVLTGRRVLAAQRGERDAFFWGWLGVAVLSLLLAACGTLALLGDDPRWGLAFGVVALAGFGGGTINVMLYRIVPFLIWLHWQRANKARARLPLLHQIVPERWQRLQLAADAIALMALVAACFTPTLARLAPLLFAASKLALGLVLTLAMRQYRQKLAILLTLPPKVRGAH